MNAAVDLPARIEAARPRLLKLAGLLMRDDPWARDAVDLALRSARGLRDGSAAGSTLTGYLEGRIAEQLQRRLAEADDPADTRGDDGADRIDALFDADGRRTTPVVDCGDPGAAPSGRPCVATMQSCIEELPPDLARVLVLREWMRYDTDAICRILGLSTAQCRVRLFRARLLLSESLQRRWPAARSA